MPEIFKKTFNLPLFDWIKQLKRSDSNTWIFNEYDFFINDHWSVTDHKSIRDKILTIQQPTTIIVDCFDAVHPVFQSQYQDQLNFIINHVLTNPLINFIFISVNYFPELKHYPKYYYFPEYHAYYYPMYLTNSNLDDSIITKKFLSLNKREDLVRQLLYIKFFNSQYLNDSYFSYLGENNDYTKLYRSEQWDFNCNLIVNGFQHHIPEINSWQYPVDRFLKIESDELLDLYQGQRKHGIEGDPTWMADPTLFQTSFCSIICETGVSASKPNFSEKTFRAIMQGHLIILLGAPNSIKMLRELGFDMYDDIIDHSYDSIDNDGARIAQVFKLIDKIGSYSIDKLSDIKRSLRYRREENIKKYQQLHYKMLSKHDTIFNEIKQNVQSKI